jgi:hypothetical protein
LKVETLSELLDWCSAIHSRMAERMTRGAEATADGPTRWLMEYVAKHEAQMAAQMDATRDDADPGALKTWVQDWFQHPPARPDEITEGADQHQAFEAVSRTVFDAHNEIMKVLRTVIGQADVPESRDLIEQMVTLEEGHSRQIGQQMNRISDM